jgi:Ca2+-binding RTX toxin-like protein
MANSTFFNRTNTLVDGILSGSMWSLPNDGVITWAAQNSTSFSWGNYLTAFDSLAAIVSKFDEIIDVEFQYIGWLSSENISTADITVTFENFSTLGLSQNISGFAKFPKTENEGTIKLNLESTVLETFTPGKSGYHTVIHEIGHALGLSHPHDGGPWSWPSFSDLGISAQDSMYTTVMSYEPPIYSWSYGWATTPMIWDAYALQTMYGAEDQTRTGNQTYYLLDDNTANVIWDSGGTDTISASKSVYANWIDLRQGYFSGVSNDVTGIAFNTLIEAAIGSKQSDTIVGNYLDNTIQGMSGNDLIYGRDGNDIIFGEDGNDIIFGEDGNDIINGGEGRDTSNYSTSTSLVKVNLINGTATSGIYEDTLVGIETIIGSDYADILLGDSGVNRLTGGKGNDLIFGDAGNDIIYGDDGSDILDGGTGTDILSYSALKSSVSVNLSDGQAINGNNTDFLSNIEWVLGSNYNDNIIGDTKPNVIEGSGGDDTIDGGLGTDTASFVGLISEYTAVESGYSIIVTDTNASRDGVDTVTSIEAFEFSGTSAFLSDLLNPTDVDNGVYRFFNLGTGTHFYSASPVERDYIINTYDQFNYEGGSFKSAGAASSDTAGVHRFFNTQLGTHFFTQNDAEKENVVATLPHYSYEGIEYQAYTSQVDGSIALYRFFNTVNGAHFFTPSEGERDSVIENLPVYNYEGIAYYVDAIV